jgi:hypothetical protein
MRVSGEILHVLALASRQGTDIWWVPLVDGKGSQSRTVGRHATIATCWRHGWLERNTSNLTPEGRAILHAEDARREARDLKEQRKSLLRVMHWESGYRCHGLWNDGRRVACVGLGPKGLWDGVYRWRLDPPLIASGEANTLAEAKRATELALLACNS